MFNYVEMLAAISRIVEPVYKKMDTFCYKKIELFHGQAVIELLKEIVLKIFFLEWVKIYFLTKC